MATIVTDAEFREAARWWISNEAAFTGPLFVDAAGRRIIDEGVGNADITPATATLEAALDNANAEIADDATIKTARTGLKNNIALAHHPVFAPEIRSLFNATLAETDNQTIQPTRFNNIRSAIESAPQAFQDRFNGDLMEEAGLDVLLIVTIIEQRQYCAYARHWATQMALLLDR